jgi:hypothetical protein
MANFDFLKQYVITDEDIDEQYEEVQRMKHSFLPVDPIRISQAEEKLGFPLPKELKEFYTEIGYGYMYQVQESQHNTFMYPLDVADAYLRTGEYDNNFLSSTGLYDEPYKLLFYDAMEGCFAWMDLRESKATSTVYYIGEDDKIADSLEDFLRAYDVNPNLLKEFSAASRKNRPQT